MKYIIWICRILFGLTFIFSGFVKAIDPLGYTYKIQDYFIAFETQWLFSLALPLAIFISVLEFVVGAGILLGLKMRLSASLGLLFMIFFTPLTLFIAIADPVPDCGCFGDAIIISNWDTFYKNLFLLAAAIILFSYRKKFRPWLSEKKDWYMLAITTLIITGLSVYCLLYLPIIDFRPWKEGNNVNELMIPRQEVADIYLIFENKETGERKEYPADDYPWNDEQWMKIWEYKEQRREVILPYQEAPISNFVIQDEYGDDYTDYFLSNPDYQFIVVAYDLMATREKAFTKRINPLARHVQNDGYSFIVLTGSPYPIVEEFRHRHQTAYPFFQAGETELKTIIRSNPGLLLLKDGVVIEKWPARCIPDYEKVRKEHLDKKD